MAHRTKEQIGDWASRLSEIAGLIIRQLKGSFPSDYARFLLGMLDRQQILLKDISRLLLANRDRDLQSVFILFRCLIDDFIFLMRFHMNKFHPETINQHTGDSMNQVRKMMKQSQRINETFFDGKEPNLATEQYYNEKVKKEVEDKNTDPYFTDGAKTKFKTFPTTSKFFEELSNATKGDYPAEIAKGNVHSITLWQLHSKYTHYSMFTFALQGGKESREIEIDQLQEALTYCYKSMSLLSEALKMYGLDNKFDDPTGLQKEIMPAS